MTWNQLTKSKNSSATSIELWLVSNSSYWPDRIKTRKIAHILKLSHVKTSKCFTNRILPFRLRSLVSHHSALLQKCFTKRILYFFLFSVVNYSQLCSFRPMHTQFRSILHDLKPFDKVKKQFCCLHRTVVGLKFKLLTRQKKRQEKMPTF